MLSDGCSEKIMQKIFSRKNVNAKVQSYYSMVSFFVCEMATTYTQILFNHDENVANESRIARKTNQDSSNNLKT